MRERAYVLFLYLCHICVSRKVRAVRGKIGPFVNLFAKKKRHYSRGGHKRATTVGGASRCRHAIMRHLALLFLIIYSCEHRVRMSRLRIGAREVGSCRGKQSFSRKSDLQVYAFATNGTAAFSPQRASVRAIRGRNLRFCSGRVYCRSYNIMVNRMFRCNDGHCHACAFSSCRCTAEPSSCGEERGLYSREETGNLG